MNGRSPVYAGVMHPRSMDLPRRFTIAGSAPLTHAAHVLPVNGRDMGLFARIMTGLAGEAPDNKPIAIDATYLKAHPLPDCTCKACVRGARPQACG
jgi:hypothetical protein